MISFLRGVFMADELPSGNKAVYIFLEMIALGFALEAVAALMRGDVWWKWAGALAIGVLFLVAGVKSQKIILKLGPRLVYYLNLRPTWIAVFIVLSLYILQKKIVLDFVMNLHQRWHGWIGYAAFALGGALLLSSYWWLTGVMLKPAPLPLQPAAKQTTAPKEDDKPPTLLDLFRKDFPNMMKASDNEDAYIMHSPDGSTLKIKRQTYMDFDAKTKFVGFYIPMPTPPSADWSGQKTVIACMELLKIDAVRQTFDHFEKRVAILGGYGDQMTSLQDLTFSGRVLIYYEEFLSIPKKAEILKAYEARGLSVTFRGTDYLGTQVIAWHQKHAAKGAH
jgi:hypothetical protein